MAAGLDKNKIGGVKVIAALLNLLLLTIVLQLIPNDSKVKIELIFPIVGRIYFSLYLL